MSNPLPNLDEKKRQRLLSIMEGARGLSPVSAATAAALNMASSAAGLSPFEVPPASGNNVSAMALSSSAIALGDAPLADTGVASTTEPSGIPISSNGSDNNQHPNLLQQSSGMHGETHSTLATPSTTMDVYHNSNSNSNNSYSVANQVNAWSRSREPFATDETSQTTTPSRKTGAGEGGDDEAGGSATKRIRVDLSDQSPDGDTKGPVQKGLDSFFPKVGRSAGSATTIAMGEARASRGSGGSSASRQPAAAAAAASAASTAAAPGVSASAGGNGIQTSSSNNGSQAASSSKASSSAAATSNFPVPSNVNGSSSSSGPSEVNELRRALDMLKTSREQLESQLQRKEVELKSVQESREESEATNERLRKKLEETHRAMAKEAARRNRDRLAQDSVRLGKLTTVRNGMGPNSLAEVWEKGYAFHELAQQREDLNRRRERLEERKKELQKLRRRRGNAAASSVPTFDGEPLVEAAVALTDDLDNIAEQHAINILQERLKKEESQLAEKERLLDAERGSHEKELRRVQCEDRSRFYRELDLPLLGNGRYSLLKLLGQGGFSEVWLALDLMTLQEVAVKIHQWNNTWTEERKQSFTRHVARELEIQAGMSHPRVVRLLGTFEIDRFSLATVMEYCRGTDLDEVLKKHRFLPEKEAKAILLQIASGLKYLASDSSSVANGGATETRIGGTVWRKRAIIHYDLKPANILFDEMGDAKITDFGLSKVFDETSEGTSMELTSQGAGTYWYLPPECFPRPGEPVPRISSKVDVWSLGVIYYQMLFGRRPFGEGMSQQAVFASGAIVRANAVEFPTDPRFRVTDEAKEFIRGCLTHDQSFRWDVNQMCNSPYVRR